MIPEVPFPADAADEAAPTSAGTLAHTGLASVTEAVASKLPWYKRKGIVIPVGVAAGIIVIIGVSGALAGGGDADTVAIAEQPVASEPPVEEVVEEAAAIMVAVPSVVGMTGTDAQAALAALGFQVDAGGGDLTMPVTAQNVAAGVEAEEGTTVKLTLQEKPKLTLGQENAIRSAEQYLSFMGFSRVGLFEQLTSEYGEGFAAEDAEFAIATLEQGGRVDWNAEAAESAQSYLDTMAFSRDGLFQQLTSEYGEGFTADQANAGLAAVGY